MSEIPDPIPALHHASVESTEAEDHAATAQTNAVLAQAYATQAAWYVRSAKELLK